MPITYVRSQQCFVYFLLSALNVITLRNRAHVHGARTTALVNLHMNYPKKKKGWQIESFIKYTYTQFTHLIMHMK